MKASKGEKMSNFKIPYLLIPLIALVLFSLFTGCSKDTPQSQTVTIGVVNLTPALDPVLDGFKAGMQELGYIEDENVTYVYQGPTNSIEGLVPALRKLKEGKVDLIFSLSTPATVTAKEAVDGTGTPVVFAPVNDPVRSGVIDSLRHPGGNLTGIKVAGFIPGALERLQRISPGLKVIFVPHNPEDKSSVLGLSELRDAAAKAGVKIELREVRTKVEIEKAVDTIPQKADAIFFLPDNLILSHISDFAEAAIRRSLPLSSVSFSQVAKGALLSFGPEFFQIGKQASRLANQILRGVKPAELPSEEADFFFSLNLKTAKAIQLHIPDGILRQANKIIR
jgi:putative ABC transport system substrate-binding protein